MELKKQAILVLSSSMTIASLLFTYTRLEKNTHVSIAPRFPDVHAEISVEDLPEPREPLSQHDEHIEKASRDQEVNWRFTAALIFVESSFNDQAKSKAGALGLMQVMPIVYRELNEPIEIHPESNIRVGLTYFKKLYGIIRAKSSHDRLLMTLAAYNAGLGHLRDAQRLAIAKGMSPHAWKDLRVVYPMLEDEDVHTQTLHGYCEGRGIVAYAEKIVEKYRYFKKIYPEDGI